MTKYSKYNGKKPILPIVSFALCGLILASCSSSNNNDTTTTPPDTTALSLDTVLNVQVLDTNGDTVEGATVNITSDPDDIIPDDQESQVTETVPSGLVTYTPSDFTGTKTLQIIASKDGFLSNNIPYEVVSGESNEASIVITSISSDTTGINTASASGDNSVSDIVSEAKEGDGADDSKTTVRIIADSGVTTEDGTTLGNNLTVVVAQYDHDEPLSLDAFPGGFAANIENPGDLANSTDEPVDGVAPTDGNVIFESVGFTAIEVKDDEGNIAKNFNKPVEVSTKVDSSFVNPTTGETIKAGDTIPIWSFEASTGKWRYEKTGTVISDPDGGLKVDYTVTHLSYYNLDYFRGGRCNSSVTFVDTNGSPAGYLYGRVQSQGWSHSFRYPGNGPLTLLNAPSNRTVEFTSLRTSTGQTVGVTSPTGPVNLCDTSPLTVTVDIPVIEYSQLTASSNAYCSNDSSAADVPISGTYVWIFNDRWSYIGRARTDNNGGATFQLPAGSYRVIMYDRVNRAYIRSNITLTSATPGTAALRVPQTCVITTGGSGTTQ